MVGRHPAAGAPTALLLASVLAPSPAGAQGESIEIRALQPTRELHGVEASIDPDEPGFEYSVSGGRWATKAGASLLLVGIETPGFRGGVSLDGFIALENFTAEHGVPWQAFRGSIGFRLSVAAPGLDARLPWPGGLHLDLAFVHESDHVAYYGRFLDEIVLIPDRFFNQIMSSYEYLKARAVLRQELVPELLTVQAAAGARWFVAPSDHDDQRLRRLDRAFLAELRLSLTPGPRAVAYLAAFFEVIRHDFEPLLAGFDPTLDYGPLRYRLVELGAGARTDAGRSLVAFVGYGRSRGRGIDFALTYGREGRFGLRFEL